MAWLEQKSFETKNNKTDLWKNKSDISSQKIWDNIKETKEKIKILEFFDEIEISEEKQDKYLKEIQKYKITFSQIENIFDENDLIEIIKKEKVNQEKEKVNQEKEKVNQEKEKVNQEKEKVNQEKEKVNQEKEEVNQEKEKVNQEKEEVNQEKEKKESLINQTKVVIGTKNNELENRKNEKNSIEYNLKNFEKNKKHIDDIIKLKDLLWRNLLDEKYGWIMDIINSIDTENFEINSSKNFDKLIEKIKNPKTFTKIADDLGGPEDSKYREFKSSLVSIDPSFNKYFNDYENIKSWKSLDAESVIEGIEKWSGGMLDIDLDDVPPKSKLHLVGSEYSFDKEIDTSELDKITNENQEQLDNIKIVAWWIKEFGNNFNLLKWEINKIKDKENFAELWSKYLELFIQNKLNNLLDVYEYTDFPEDIKITENDISNLNDLENLNNWFKKIDKKLEKMTQHITKIQTWILKKYEEDIKELVKRKQERKEKELQILKFLHKIGFDLIPQSITNQLVENINFAPKVYWFDAKIDLENWDLGIRGFWDDYSWAEYRKKFTEIFIKMVWNPKMDWKNLFNVDNINNSSTVIDSSKLNLYLNTNWFKWFWAFQKMKDNLDKSKK